MDCVVVKICRHCRFLDVTYINVRWKVPITPMWGQEVCKLAEPIYALYAHVRGCALVCACMRMSVCLYVCMSMSVSVVGGGEEGVWAHLWLVQPPTAASWHPPQFREDINRQREKCFHMNCTVWFYHVSISAKGRPKKSAWLDGDSHQFKRSKKYNGVE